MSTAILLEVSLWVDLWAQMFPYLSFSSIPRLIRLPWGMHIPLFAHCGVHWHPAQENCNLVNHQHDRHQMQAWILFRVSCRLRNDPLFGWLIPRWCLPISFRQFEGIIHDCDFQSNPPNPTIVVSLYVHAGRCVNDEKNPAMYPELKFLSEIGHDCDLTYLHLASTFEHLSARQQSRIPSESSISVD